MKRILIALIFFAAPHVAHAQDLTLLDTATLASVTSDSAGNVNLAVTVCHVNRDCKTWDHYLNDELAEYQATPETVIQRAYVQAFKMLLIDEAAKQAVPPPDLPAIKTPPDAAALKSYVAAIQLQKAALQTQIIALPDTVNVDYGPGGITTLDPTIRKAPDGTYLTRPNDAKVALQQQLAALNKKLPN